MSVTCQTKLSIESSGSYDASFNLTLILVILCSLKAVDHLERIDRWLQSRLASDISEGVDEADSSCSPWIPTDTEASLMLYRIECLFEMSRRQSEPKRIIYETQKTTDSDIIETAGSLVPLCRSIHSGSPVFWHAMVTGYRIAGKLIENSNLTLGNQFLCMFHLV
ncbi:unnamed protein product [Protopolystoma xenopodis]|uniref:Uncharacterized protein n=1 Tax=Protopolystoma xenopodis TaxID=117903 RepID=A0A3S4ZP86_9PLAT|nr:unnamed protein product [Protopolystoma xenopodis]